MRFVVSKKRQLLTILLVLILAVGTVFGVCYFEKSKNNKSWDKAKEYYKTGQYQKILDEIGKNKIPEDPAELEIYAHANFATKNLDKSFAAYEQLYQSSHDLSSKLMMGNIKLEQGDKTAAENYYREAIQVNSGFVQAYLNLASLYRTDGKISQANEILTQANKNNPNNSEIIEYYLSINQENKDSDDYKNWSTKLQNIGKNNI